jgi:hypothetical protein
MRGAARSARATPTADRRPGDPPGLGRNTAARLPHHGLGGVPGPPREDRSGPARQHAEHRRNAVVRADRLRRIRRSDPGAVRAGGPRQGGGQAPRSCPFLRRGRRVHRPHHAGGPAAARVRRQDRRGPGRGQPPTTSCSPPGTPRATSRSSAPRTTASPSAGTSPSCGATTRTPWPSTTGWRRSSCAISMPSSTACGRDDERCWTGHRLPLGAVTCSDRS